MNSTLAYMAQISWLELLIGVAVLAGIVIIVLLAAGVIGPNKKD